MKKIFYLLFTLLIFVGCQKQKQRKTTENAQTTASIVAQECYRGIMKKDTILMTLHLKGNEVTAGTLRYQFFEKDSNEGEISGQLKGDTLFATYTFMSEGAASVRDVAFLKKGNTYIEGHGEISDDNQGNITFKDVRQLRFDGKLMLSAIRCD